MSKPTRFITKREAQEMLSKQLRSNLDVDLLIKTLNLYAKISGWDKEPTPSQPEDDNLDKLVAAVERKRRGRVV